jgi:ubiquinone/menaquinone biosynthesis C-methylase UbiE
MENEERFFDFAAYAGFTKHLGGVAATRDLAAACHIGEGSYVLDVGCGAGVTPCFLVQEYRCRVVGVDILKGMIDRCNERARRVGVKDSVEFRVADAQDLPFENDLFDAVITESVTAFPKDKGRTVNEYARVCKLGGYVGLNESTWLKTPPPPEMVAWASQEVGGNVQPLTADQWVSLMRNANLSEIQVKTYGIDIREETRGMLQRYGCLGMFRVWSRMFALYLRNPAYRRFVKGLRNTGIVPDNIDHYFGYGLYVGRK